MTLELKVRPAKHQRHLRCAWCHDRIAPALARRCDGCNTLLHFDCAAQNGRCVSPGCPHQAAPQIRVRPRRRLEPRWAGLLAACATLTALLSGAAVFDQLQRGMWEAGPQVVVAPPTPEMHALLIDVSEGRRGPEVVDEVLQIVRDDPQRAHAVSQFSLVQLLGQDAVPALQDAWHRESDLGARRWILGALGSCESRAVDALPEIMEGVEDPRSREAALFVLLRVGYYAEEFPPGAEATLREIGAGEAPYAAYLARQALEMPGFGLR